MKTILLTICFFASALIATAQKSDLAFTASTDQITETGQYIGITNISVAQKGNSFFYTLSGSEIMTANGSYSSEAENFSVYESPDYIGLTYHSVVINMTKKDGAATITISGGKPFMPSEAPRQKLNNTDKQNMNIAMVLLNEVINKSAPRNAASASRINPSGGGGRRIWVTIQVGQSNSVAIANLNAEVQQFLADHPGCTLYGSVESHCLFWSYGCVATQHYMCP